MNRKLQQGIAAFTVTGIIFLGACGFAAVDASTNRYIQDEYSALFLISAADAGKIQFSLLGKAYTFSAGWSADNADTLWQYRGMLPHSISAPIYLAAKGLAELAQS